jgi:hypothetical protein
MLAAGRAKTRQIGQELVLHTIDKTTLPNPEKRARIAALLGGATPPPPPIAPAQAMRDVRPVAPAYEPAAESPPNLPPPGLGMTRDDRARQMLLRSTKQRT